MKTQTKTSPKNDRALEALFFKPLLTFIVVIVIAFLFSFLIGSKKVFATISATPVHQYTGSSISGSGTYTITLTSAPTQGNTLIFTQAGGDSVNHHVTSLSQTGVTWAVATSSPIASQDIWYGVVGANPSSTLTINLSGGGSTVAISNLSEWSGLSPIPLDQKGVNTGNSSTPATTTITPQSGADVLIIDVARKGGTGTISSPFTALTSTDGSFVPGYRVVTNASGSYTGNWSWSSSGGWTTTVADFLAQIVDTTAPSIPGGLNGTAFSPTRIDLSWASSTDNQAVSYYTLYRCSGASCTPTSLVASSTVLSYSDTGLLGSTVYGYAITATDLQNNQSAKSSTIYITTPSSDTLPPVLSNGSPTGTVTANPLNATLSLSTDENATCKYGTISGTAYASIANTFGTTGGTTHSQSLTGLSAGSHTYYVRCIDSASNANTSDYAITFTMALADITAPVISITSPTNGSTVANTVNLSANSSDNIGVVGVRFLLDGVYFGNELTGTSITSTSTSLGAGADSDGTHSLFAVARDAAGNYATSSTVTFTINNHTNWKFRTITYNNTSYNFSVFVPPGYTSATRWPIILSMPGQASFPFPDNDGFSQTKLDFGEYTVRPAENTFPAIVVFPQYINITGTNNQINAYEVALAMAEFNQELAEFNVDPQRIYLEGSSFGGMRSWGILYNNSTLFAAAVTLSGGNTSSFEITGNANDTLPTTNALTATRLKNKPIWILHSAGDAQVSVQYDRDMYAALQAAGATATIYTEYPGSTHGLWYPPYGFNDPAITNPTVLNWLMAQSLTADTSAPTAPPSLTGTVSPTQVDLTWASSTDNNTVTAYKVYKCSGASCSPTTFIATTTTLSYSATGLTQSTQYGFAVTAVDGSYNESSKSSTFATTTTSSADVTAPTVSLTAPSNGATVSGSSVSVTANASDNVGVSGVQFKLDSVNLGAEDTTSSYGITWNSTSATNGSHTLLAVARDAAGNYATSTTVTVTVDNAAPVISNGSPSGNLTTATTTAIISVTTNENATCKYGTTASTAYASIANTFTTTGGTTHTKNLTGLTPASYIYYVRCIDSSSNANLSDYTISFNIPAAPDTTPPTAPTSLTGVFITPTQVTLSWASSTDTVGVTAYHIYKCTGSGCTPTTSIATSTILSYADTSLATTTSYVYAITALDAAYNESTKSSTFATTTPLVDTLPPVVSNTSPSGTLTGGTVSVTLSVNTDENATCKFGTVANTAYGSIANTFSSTGGITHSSLVTGLTVGSYNYYIRCVDGLLNTNSSDSLISFSIPAIVDNQPPVISNGSPSGSLSSGTTAVTLSVTTDENASCRFDTNLFVPYVDMENTFTTTGGTSHSSVISGLTAGTYYYYYVRCIDTSSNVNVFDYPVYFIISSTSSIPDPNAYVPPPSYSGSSGYRRVASTVVYPSTSTAITNLINQNKALLLEAYSKGITLSPFVLQILGINNNVAPQSSLRIARDLKLNAIGTDVRRLQNFLISQSTGPAAQALAEHHSTAIFGVLTEAALAEYQASVGLPATGFCGPLTRKILN